MAEKPLHARSQTLRLLLRRTGSDVLRGTAEVDGAGEQRLELRRVAPAEVEGMTLLPEGHRAEDERSAPGEVEHEHIPSSS